MSDSHKVLTDLPIELILRINEYLEPSDMNNARAVSKIWHQFFSKANFWIDKIIKLHNDITRAKINSIPKEVTKEDDFYQKLYFRLKTALHLKDQFKPSLDFIIACCTDNFGYVNAMLPTNQLKEHDDIYLNSWVLVCVDLNCEKICDHWAKEFLIRNNAPDLRMLTEIYFLAHQTKNKELLKLLFQRYQFTLNSETFEYALILSKYSINGALFIRDLLNMHVNLHEDILEFTMECSSASLLFYLLTIKYFEYFTDEQNSNHHCTRFTGNTAFDLSLPNLFNKFAKLEKEIMTKYGSDLSETFMNNISHAKDVIRLLKNLYSAMKKNDFNRTELILSQLNNYDFNLTYRFLIIAFFDSEITTEIKNIVEQAIQSWDCNQLTKEQRTFVMEMITPKHNYENKPSSL